MYQQNGDAISKAYAGTSALKGDFTRTGKRNLLGSINDARNSLARLVAGATTDFFTQSVLDFVHGQRGLGVFAEFLERLQGMSDGGCHVFVADITLP